MNKLGYQDIKDSARIIYAKKRKVKQKLIIKYWGIIAIMHHQKIKVILKQKGQNGNICFWSIIPAWTTNKYRDIKFFSAMKGNPEED